MRSNSITSAVLALALGLCQWGGTAFAKEINGKDYQEYTVKKGETLFGICRKFNTSVSEMEKVNPSLKKGLKSDVTIYVPSGAPAHAANNAGGAPVRQLVEHKVAGGETLSALARKYNTSVADITARNEAALKNGLKSGSTLKIYQNSALKNAVPPSGKTTASAAAPAGKSAKASANMPAEHTVKKGETLFGICKKYGCTTAAVEELNPALKKRSIYEGEKLVMPNGKNTAKSQKQSGVTVHEVKKGETVYSIATDYQVKPTDIERLNPAVKKDGLKAGKPLIMPSTSKYLADKNSSADYRVHQVQKDETVFSISKKFGVSPSDVMANNDVKQGVKAGQLLALPPSQQNKQKTGVASQYRQNATAAAPKHANVAHTVRKGETMFSICKAYKVTERDLVMVNPELRDGLKADKIIFIPRAQDRKIAWSSSYFVSSQGNNKVNVAIMLPFAASADGGIDANTDKFLEFYQGALLAVKKLKEQNAQVNLYTYNSGKTEADIRAILAKQELQDVDVIIGPAYKAQFAPLSEFAQERNVKMVVPFSSRTDEMATNPNIFLVNAPKNKVAEETAKLMAPEFRFKNVVLLKLKASKAAIAATIATAAKQREKDPNAPVVNEKELEAELTEKLNDKQETADSIAAHLRRQGTHIHVMEYTTADALKAALKEKEENIIITTSTDQAALSQLIPTINAMATLKYDVKIFGYSDWSKFQTISNDLFVTETYFASS